MKKTKATPGVKFGKLTAGKHQEFKEGTAKKPAPHKGGKVVDNPKKMTLALGKHDGKKGEK